MNSRLIFTRIGILRKPAAAAVFLFIFSFAAGTLRAQFIPIGPFSGAVSETFDAPGFIPGFTNSPVSIMGGAALIQSTNYVTIIRPGTFNFGLGDSSANAPHQCAVPFDGQNLVAFESGSGIAAMDVVFTNTIKAFGGYWGAAAQTNAPATITFTFFDAADHQIGAPQSVSYVRLSGDGMLEWHGWFSSTPFKRVEVTPSGSTLVGDSFRAGAVGFSVITSIAPLNATQFVLQGSGTTGVVYTVQASTNLAETNWTTAGTVQPNASGNFLFTNVSAFPLRFYRLQAP